MIICKVCNSWIKNVAYPFGYDCPDCHQYSMFCYDKNYELYSEVIQFKDYYLNFGNKDKVGSIIYNSKVIQQFPMERLTHEVALEYLEKFKRWSTFR